MNRLFTSLLLVGSVLFTASDTIAQSSVTAMKKDAGNDSFVFYRVNQPNEFLSADRSNEKGINLLGVGKVNDSDISGLTLRYIRGEKMPQYLIMKDAMIESGVIKARFLVNLNDSVEYYNGNKAQQSLFMKGEFTRLAFVEGTLYGDTLLIIQNSAIDKPANQLHLKSGAETEKGDYSPALFSFRLLEDSTEEDFLIESWSKKGSITQGEWIKIENGIPYLINTTLEASIKDAEVFNVVRADNNPTTRATIESEIDQTDIIANKGNILIKGAAGKKVLITNSLGQAIMNTSLSSDYSTIPVPPGIALVSVEGEPTIKVLVR